MKNIQILLICAVLLATAACKKEAPDPQEPVTPPDPPIYIPIFVPGDTSKGAAYANKLTADWAASVHCRTSYLDSTVLGIVLITYSSDGSYREYLDLGGVSKFNIGSYGFSTDIYLVLPGEVFSSYSTLVSDGDVLDDYYRTDSTDIKSRLIINKIDLANKRIEGTFHVAYNLQEPRRNSANPKKVTFSGGRFWAAIRD